MPICWERARKPLDEDAFLAETLRKIDSARRARMRRRLIGVLALAAALSMGLPALLTKAAPLVRAAGEYSVFAAEFSTTPLGWMLSTGVGLWVLLRATAAARS